MGPGCRTGSLEDDEAEAEEEEALVADAKPEEACVLTVPILAAFICAPIPLEAAAGWGNASSGGRCWSRLGKGAGILLLGSVWDLLPGRRKGVGARGGWVPEASA